MSNIYLEIGKAQVELFYQNNLDYINSLVTCDSIRGLMNSIYNFLTDTKKIEKIETLELEYRQSLWDQTKEYAAGRLDKKKAIELSKALYTLEYLLN